MPKTYTDAELAALVQTPGWRLLDEKYDKPLHGTLEDLLKTAHGKHKKGEAPGLIEQIETSIGLDMLQIEKLWWHLGLPV